MLWAMNQSNTIRPQFVVWGLILGLWCLLVLAFAGQLVFTNSVPWLEALRLSLRDWFPWGVLSPLVAWVATRFPLERGKLHLSIPVHIVGCMLSVLFCELVARPLPQPPLPGPGTPQFRPPLGAVGQGQAPGPEGRRPENVPPFAPGVRQPEDFQPNRPGPFLPPVEAQRVVQMNAIVMRAKFNMPIYWVIVSIVHALTYYRRSQERERKAAELEARLAGAKLEALRMQLNPHFLFNTLNAISTLVHKDPGAADEMIANLSELLRATLDNNRQEISLRQELEFLDRYLEIQQARFGERLRIEKEVDAAALGARVPTLILQPLVENAIRHGIEPQAAAGLVQIRACLEAGRLRLRVHDNGGGGRKPAKDSPGIGLANTRARLQTLYGTDARLTLTSTSDAGFTVEMEIPYREEDSNADR